MELACRDSNSIAPEVRLFVFKIAGPMFIPVDQMDNDNSPPVK